ncbi:hypothetical protein QBC32DRAFT_345658 [Pseudoneurospora amorphoporcata]|uniref:Uncharacterized protein n=1 Tax=Pseudoneurospora amorphoporcata TaxID=241081 RepID=A0AAN6NRN4_9PEZI|nr:hypothetical protein QBC32DRAFT_345658 [Pseudoneurospora amorphoporcata]
MFFKSRADLFKHVVEALSANLLKYVIEALGGYLCSGVEHRLTSTVSVFTYMIFYTLVTTKPSFCYAFLVCSFHSLLDRWFEQAICLLLACLALIFKRSSLTQNNLYLIEQLSDLASRRQGLENVAVQDNGLVIIRDFSIEAGYNAKVRLC